MIYVLFSDIIDGKPVIAAAKGKTENAATKKIIKQLKKQGIKQIYGEDLSTLYDTYVLDYYDTEEEIIDEFKKYKQYLLEAQTNFDAIYQLKTLL